MGLKAGDKGRFHKKRRAKLARREDMRALRKELIEKAAKAKAEAAPAS